MDTINLTENPTAQDQQAVAAVRSGDVGRYRELVERHERRVYAVAWSRLGDAALAEEATQEAFIRAYRRLWLLGDGAKFAAWITSITRRISINLGLRHRRELDKRERWALEQTDASPAPEESREECTPETLRQTLVELPAAHRECLVLFYLEGKSGAEAAAVLGISETSLRVRLHRARAALRERLEEKLAESLGKLRPGKTLVPAIMAVVLASSTSKAAAGTGATVVGAVVKILPVKWVFACIPLLMFLPSLIMGWWVSRMERRNYRESDGFRARLHLGFFRSFLWGYPLLVILIAGITIGAISAWGYKGMLFIIALPLVVMTSLSARLFVINQNRFHRVMFIYSLIILLGMLAVGFGLLPPQWFILVQVFSTLVFISALGDRPLRMDYNLFLRAAQGMLKNFGEPLGKTERPLTRGALIDFARFLGERWLVNNFCWEEGGLVLRLPPVKPSFFSAYSAMFFLRGSRSSWLRLGWDGRVEARCGHADEHSLRGTDTYCRAALETKVAEAVTLAWENYRQANRPAAEQAVGQVSEGDIFVVPTAQTKATRRMRWIMVLSQFLLVALIVIKMVRPTTSHMELKPVSVSAEEVHQALANLANPGHAGVKAMDQADQGLYSNHLLPRKTNDFTPAAWQVMHDHLMRMIPATVTKPEDKVDRLMGNPTLQKVIGQGWLKAEDFGLTTEQVRRCIAHPDQWHQKFWLEPYASEVGGESFKMLDLGQFASRMECLQQLQCLDAVDGSKVVATVLQHQMLSVKIPPGRRPVIHPLEWHGLFLTFGYDPITETYDALRVLALFGALDRIDRKACVEGILHFHRGKGVFGSKNEGDGLVIFGDSRDTVAGFESLRMLAALDEVKDLDKWQFRPMYYSRPKVNGPQEVRWSEIEVWLCQQRLERFLQERIGNPHAAAHSLLE